MQEDRWEGFLWGQVLLFGLLAASLGLFLSYPSLRTPYQLPELKLVLATLFMLAGGLVALLSGTRFSVEGRRFDLFLCCGFFVTSVSWLSFSIIPSIAKASAGRAELWAAVIGRMLGWGADRDRTVRPRPRAAQALRARQRARGLRRRADRRPGA